MITWRGFIVDSHHRYKICCKHGLQFPTVEYPFEDEDHALMHIHENQIGKRNVPPIRRVEHVKAADELRLKRDAKKQQLSGLTQFQSTDNQGSTVPPNLGRRCNKEDRSQRTERQLAAKAGVSHGTFHKASKLIDFADEETKEKLR